MSDTYSGNLKLLNFAMEIRKEVKRLKEGPLNQRTMRQIMDGDDFMKMIMMPPYNKAKTLGELKKIITEKREEIKGMIENCNTQLEGYQFSLFIPVKDVSDSMKNYMADAKENMEKDLKWLHKCLGICCSKDYFK